MWLMHFPYKNEYGILTPVEITVRRRKEKDRKQEIRKDE
jgi:hypothetical protein